MIEGEGGVDYLECRFAESLILKIIKKGKNLVKSRLPEEKWSCVVLRQHKLKSLDKNVKKSQK